MTNMGSRSVRNAVRNIARMAMLLAAVSLVLCVAPARAQGVGPNVVLPTTRPRTNLQIVGGGMQVPWQVSLHPATNYVAIGQCLPLYIDLLDASGKDIPRNPSGGRVTIADFDWTASGNAAVGKYDGPNSWAVCACPAAAVGSTIHVMATYPAVSLPDKSKVPGLAFQSYIELPVTPAHGTNSPVGCDNVLVTTTVAISVPGGGAPPTVVSGGHNPLQTPPASTGTPTTATPATGTPSTGTPTAVTPATGTPAAVTPPATVAALPSTVVRTGVPIVGGPVALAPPAGRDPSQAAIVPVNPARFTAVQAGPAMVVLTWDPVPGVAYYQVWGAGLPNTGVTVSAGTAQVVNNVPMGAQSWSVGSYYMPGPVSTPASAFSKTQLQVTASVVTGPSPPSGTAYPPGGGQTTVPTNTAPAATTNYRVIATGFRVLHQTKDDFLSRDGHGDEVYGGFMTFHYDRTTSQLVDQDLRRTNVIGERGYDGLDFGERLLAGVGQISNRLTGSDAAVKNSRIQGGTATQDGGLAQYDVFPAVADPSQTYGVAPTNNTFPFLVWQGALTNAKDAVVILPTLWEFDGIPDGFNKWHQSEQSNVIQIWSDPAVQQAVAGTQLGLITPSGTLETSFGLHMTAGGIFELAMIGFGPIAALTAGSYDRPIGVGMHGVGGTGGIASGPVLPRRAIVITREILEATLAKLATYNPATVAPGVFAIYGAPPVVLPAPPPGTIAVQLFESPADDLQGMYILYLKVERMP
jgi:hypothetical protein